MGVKSTVTLTREEAIARYLDIFYTESRSNLERYIRTMPNRYLEDVLERVNDEANDGEGFENYMIKD